MRQVFTDMSNDTKTVYPLTNVSLASALQQNIDTVLLLDCRSFLVYNAHHIDSAQNVLCPTILKRRAKGTVALENIVPCKDSRQKLINGDYSMVVAYDHDTNDWDQLGSDCNLKLILTSLLHEESLSTDLYYLQGGFESFSIEYPTLCASQEHKVPQFFIQSPPTSALTADCYSAPVCDQGQPVEILPFLYLGSSYHSSRKDMLDALGITALLNVSTHCPNYFPEDYIYKCIPVDDNNNANISVWFLDAIEFIDSMKVRDGRVLVHCHAGVSRSATICLAYLMRALHYRLDEAFEFVKSRRSLISPNFNFMNQLLKFESEVLSPRTPNAMLSAPMEKFPRSPHKLASPSAIGPMRRHSVAGSSSTSGPGLGLVPAKKSRRKSTENKENLST